MYIWNQKHDSFYNSENVVYFCVTETGQLFADADILGSYTTKEDALKELRALFCQLEFGATSYQVR